MEHRHEQVYTGEDPLAARCVHRQNKHDQNHPVTDVTGTPGSEARCGATAPETSGSLVYWILRDELSELRPLPVLAQARCIVSTRKELRIVVHHVCEVIVEIALGVRPISVTRSLSSGA